MESNTIESLQKHLEDPALCTVETIKSFYDTEILSNKRRKKIIQELEIPYSFLEKAVSFSKDLNNNTIDKIKKDCKIEITILSKKIDCVFLTPFRKSKLENLMLDYSKLILKINGFELNKLGNNKISLKKYLGINNVKGIDSFNLEERTLQYKDTLDEFRTVYNRIIKNSEIINPDTFEDFNISQAGLIISDSIGELKRNSNQENYQQSLIERINILEKSELYSINNTQRIDCLKEKVSVTQELFKITDDVFWKVSTEVYSSELNNAIKKSIFNA